jgi:hypothetical protein
MTPAPSGTTDAELEEARARCDPLADDVVEVLANEPAAGGGDLFARCHEAAVGGNGPCKKYIAFFAQPAPPWLNCTSEELELGQQFFWRQGVLTLLVGVTVLVDSYAGGRDNAVLLMSGRLSKATAFRRLVETAVFAFDCATPMALSPGGAARLSIARVRLLHAEVRRRCRLRGYPTQELQEPVNQEAMAGTLMLFSSGVVKALARLGIRTTVEEAESYHALWRFVGYLIGVERRFLPETFEGELMLYDRVKAHAYVPNEASRQLFDSALDGIAHGVRGLPWWVWLAGGGLLQQRGFMEELVLVCCDPSLVRSLRLRSRPGWRLGLNALRTMVAALRLLSYVIPPLVRLLLLVNTLAVRTLLSDSVLLQGCPVRFSDPGFCPAIGVRGA